MARHSQTEVAVLGALSTGPMTGYEVRRAITEVLGHFWHESYGQIYPCLAALEQSGAVRRSGRGRTSGTVFQITPAGEDRLRALLAEPHTSTPARNGLLLRLFFGAHLADGEAQHLLQQARDRASTALSRRNSRTTSHPCSRGIMTSSRIRSGEVVRALLSASAPSKATSTA